MKNAPFFQTMRSPVFSRLLPISLSSYSYAPVLKQTGDVEEAIEVCSWAEIHVVGETYEGDGFTVSIEER